MEIHSHVLYTKKKEETPLTSNRAGKVILTLDIGDELVKTNIIDKFDWKEVKDSGSTFLYPKVSKKDLISAIGLLGFITSSFNHIIDKNKSDILVDRFAKSSTKDLQLTFTLCEFDFEDKNYKFDLQDLINSTQ